MGLSHDRLLVQVASNAGAATVGDPVRVGGHGFDVQFYLPIADLAGLEVSNDRATWHVPADADGADINGPTAAIAVDDVRTVRERVEWVRMICATDAGGAGRLHRAIIGVHKLTS